MNFEIHFKIVLLFIIFFVLLKIIVKSKIIIKEMKKPGLVIKIFEHMSVN